MGSRRWQAQIVYGNNRGAGGHDGGAACGRLGLITVIVNPRFLFSEFNINNIGWKHA